MGAALKLPYLHSWTSLMFIEVMVSSYCMCLKYLNLTLSHKTKHETKSNNNKMKKAVRCTRACIMVLREKYAIL